MFTHQYQPYQNLRETGEHDDVLQTEGNVFETFAHKNTKSRKGQSHNIKKSSHKSKPRRPNAYHKNTKSRKGQAHKIKKSSHKSKPRTPNAYIIFYRDFYKQILKEEFPHISQQDKIAMTGEAWRNLSNELKNEFY